MPDTIQKPKLSEQLTYIIDKMYGHIDSYSFRDRWPILEFTEQSAAKMASIFGYITAMLHLGHVEEAERYANELVNLFDNYISGGEEVEHTFEDMGEERTVKLPSMKAAIHSDGCLHSFTFARYYLVEGNGWAHYHKVKDQIEKGEVDPRSGWFLNNKPDHFNALYKFSYNGGIIFHGPQSGETFTVRIADDNNLWGIHT